MTTMPPTLRFLGAAGTVTGSKYLLSVGSLRLLVDCGLFQGPKALRLRNRAPLPLDPGRIDAVLLTHAHLDHSGYLPLLHKLGFRGPVYCTSGSAALARILLPDAGHLQEEDARYANLHGFSKHRPALPLYTLADAQACLELLRPVPMGATVSLGPGVTATFRGAGHILGASWIEVEAHGRRSVFSGDVGRSDDALMKPPVPARRADYLVVESTYGDRRHDAGSPRDALQVVVARTIARGGIVMIPAFAVGRAQMLLHLLAQLRATGALPPVPVFLNSPMAIDATDIFCDHADEHRLTPRECHAMCNVATYVVSADASRALNRRSGPMIVLSASGMASGGRILHHFRAWIGDDRNTVLFAGFQAAGTRGADLVSGARTLRIHGATYDVRAEVRMLSSLSAHADADELLSWLQPAAAFGPKRIFVTHGEPAASAALAARIGGEMRIDAVVPADGTEHTLA